MSIGDLETAEEEAGAPDDNIGSDEEAVASSPSTTENKEENGGFGYRDEGKGSAGGAPNRLRNNPVGKFISKNKLIAGAGGGGMLLLLAVLMIFFLASTLKIPNLAQHILEYNMFSTARTFRQGIENGFSEKMAADASEEGFVKSLKEKLGSSYNDFRGSTWGKLDKFRPARTLKNLKAENRLEYVYEEVDRSILPGKKLNLKALRIDGHDVNIADLKTGRYFSNLNERLRFSAQIDVALKKAVPDVPNIVRSKMAKQIRSELGIKLRWWEKAAKDYKGLTKEEAFKQQQQEAYDKIKSDATGGCATASTCNSSKTASDATDEAVKNGTAPEEDLNYIKKVEAGSVPMETQEAKSTVLQSIKNATKDSVGADVLRSASSYYQIALPVCMIYDASVVKSQPTVDAKSASLEKAFYGLESANDQQRIGATATNVVAVGAYNNKLSNITGSLPEQRAYKQALNTRDFVSQPDEPQNGGIGENMSIINVFAGTNFISKFTNGVLDRLCPVVLDLRVVGVSVAVEIIMLALSGGSTAAAEKAAAEGTSLAVEKVIGKVVAEVVEKEVVTNVAKKTFSEKAKDMILRLGKDTILYGGMSVLAKLMVLAHMGGNTTGLETSASFANRADMGGNLAATDLHRKALMGRSLTQSEQISSRLQDKKDLAYNVSQESVWNRYFAISNPHSLLANIGFGIMNNWGSSVNAQISSLRNFFAGNFIIKNLSTLQNLMPGHNIASAAINNQISNYGMVPMGWTNDELNTIRTNASYRPVVNDELFQRNPKKDEIISEYSVCFTETMGNLLAKGYIVKDKIDDPSVKCSSINLSMNNPKYGDGVFRYRLSGLNNYALDHLLEIQDPEANGSESGQSPPPTTGNSIVGDPYTSSVDVACANGTTDLGVHDGYVHLAIVKMRLCALPNLPSGSGESTPGNSYYVDGADGKTIVNSRVSGAWFTLVNNAKTAGVSISASSSFRTMAHQQALCSNNSKCLNGDHSAVAQPGNSPHQAGVAIDFANMGGSAASGRTCATRQSWDSDAWRWLRDNASRYGFKQYANEAWHWDASTLSNRCG